MEKRELAAIVISILVMTFILVIGNLINNNLTPEVFFFSLFAPIIIISISVIAKKLVARKLDIKISHKIWEMQRYWIGKRSHWKNPLPFGLILPLIISFISAGTGKLFTFMQFESQALPAKATKMYGRRRFSTVLDWDEALVVFYSLMIVLLVGIIVSSLSSSLWNTSYFAELSFYYVLSNMIPFSQLDGNKLFFGSRPLYFFSLILLAISSIFIFF